MARNDREREGLQGPVRVCVETTEPSGGKAYSVEITYNVAGNLLTTRGIPETWSRARTYDELGRLAKISDVQSDELKHETFYSYNDDGRVSAIKTVGNEEQLKKGGGFTMPIDALFEARDEFVAPFSGTLRILYNDLGQATELHTFDVEGQLVSKAFRVYDPNGWMIEETETRESPDFRFPESIPPETRAEMKPEELEFAKRMFERFRQIGRTRKSFTYDAKGQLVKGRLETLAMIVTRSITYNEKGGIAETRRGIARNDDFFHGPHGINAILALRGSKETAKSVPADWPVRAENRTALEKYDYIRYDEHGNWTEQKGTLQSGPLEQVVLKRRTLSYF